MKQSRRKWTEEEDDFLRKNYLEQGEHFCIESLKRTQQAIHNRIYKLKISKKNSWTTEEEIFLIENYPKMGSIFCAKFLKRNNSSVTRKVQRLNLKKY